MPVLRDANLLMRALRDISGADIGADAARPLRIDLMGPANLCDAVRERLLSGLEPSVRDAAVQAMRDPDPSAASVALWCHEGSATCRDDMVCWDLEQPVTANARTLIAARPDLCVRLGALFPELRSAAVSRIIRDTSAVNAKIAMLSAAPTVFPFLAAVIPPAVMADMLLLTRNQLIMVMRLAAVHGKSPQASDRLAELTPVIAGAFGWRALARELIGLVPAGAGVVLKGVVAWAGTATVGKAAAYYLRTGRRMSRRDRTAAYQQAMGEARYALEPPPKLEP